MPPAGMRRIAGRMHSLRGALAVALLPPLIALSTVPAGSAQITAASSTTTTQFSGTTTMTLVPPNDISAGGNFEGGFEAGGFDIFVFTLDEPRVALLETVRFGPET